MSAKQRVLDRREYPIFPECIPPVRSARGHYASRFATSSEDLDSVMRLRFEVFNLELGEGLDESYDTGRDCDIYDLSCHHLMVSDLASDRLVGTYRMQTSTMAAQHNGFYSADLFDLSSLPRRVIDDAVELSRACIARDFRQQHVLFFLWRGLAAYVKHNRKRYLFGCCSLTSQDPDDGRRVMAHLTREQLVHPEYRVSPQPHCACYAEQTPTREYEPVELPSLFRTYVRHGALICGPPAIDRSFKTIDFLVLFDIEKMDPSLFRLFFD
ncbi:MAG: GNAT family N-acetyltransferase [Acidobacteriota bacterium]|nr:MAG: GNAT family N-acetyltransferase [Acidobacteriota bacterium]